ncbi:MAG: DMT family transporter [Desulfovibrionaceae bacterium]|nr:DMT family transporter [Desulfovibrionaceae bacterium]
MMRTKITSICALLCSSFLLAAAFIPTRYLGTQGVGVFSEIFIRYLVPACILALFFPHCMRTVSRRALLQSMLTGILLWIALIFAIYGIRTIEYASMGLLLVTLYVLLVPLATTVIDKKMPSLRLLMCATLCFCGLALLIIGKPLGTPNLGTLLCFLASIFYASYLLVSSHILDTKLSAYSLHFYQSITLAILSIPGMIFIEDSSLITIIQESSHRTPLLISLAFIGFFIGFITYQCLFYGQKYLAPTLVVIILSTKNAFGAILDITIFNLPIEGIQYLAYGIVIIATGIASLSPNGTKS